MAGTLSEKIKAINEQDPKQATSSFPNTINLVPNVPKQVEPTPFGVDKITPQEPKKCSAPNSEERMKKILFYILATDGALLALALGRFIVIGM